ncbi:MAG: hypothetical protein ACRCWI_08670 [Brevinema sp.]
MYLLLFLLCSSSLFGMATRPTTLEYQGRLIEIPKDIKYRHNRVENTYTLQYRYPNIRFEFSMDVLNTKIVPMFDFKYSGTGWLEINSSAVCIQNPDGQTFNYAVTWEIRNTFVNNSLMHERYSVSDEGLLKFLLTYVQNDSKIKIQFYGKSFSETSYLYKKDVRRLKNMIDIYKQLIL